MNAKHSIVPINVAAAWPEQEEETVQAIPNDLGHHTISCVFFFISDCLGQVRRLPYVFVLCGYQNNLPANTHL